MDINEIQDILKYSICVACLSRDRNMKPISKSTLEKIFANKLLVQHEELLICWECQSLLRNLNNFKSKVLEADEQLSKLINNYLPINNINCLSNLQISPQNKIYIDPETNSLKEVVINVTEIKIESEAKESCSTEPKEVASDIKTKLHGDTDAFLEINPTPIEFLIESKAKIEVQSEWDLPLSQVKEVINCNLQAKNELIDIEIVKNCDDSDAPFSDGNHNDDNDYVVSENHTNVKSIKKGKIKFKHKTIKKKFKSKKAPDTEDESSTSIKGSRKGTYTIHQITHENLLKKLEERRNHEKYVKSTQKCEGCLVIFPQRWMLERHKENVHSMSMKHECSVCQQRFETKSLRDGHCKLHYRVYECNICKEIIDKRDHAASHYRRVHKKAERKCSDCNLTFMTHTEIDRHRRVYHKKLDDVKCRYCPKVLASKDCRKRHEEEIHNGTVANLECDICHKTIKGERGLAAHIKRAHSGTVDECSYCVECNKQFQDKHQYRKHLQTSVKHVSKEELLRFTCAKCGMKFQTNFHLNLHMDRVHLKTFRFICDICNEGFYRRHVMVKHIMYKHEGKPKPPSKKEEICSYCGRMFSNKEILRNHVRTHTGERPYVCKICSASFAHRATLLNHTKMVHYKMSRDCGKQQQNNVRNQKLVSSIDSLQYSDEAFKSYVD